MLQHSTIFNDLVQYVQKSGKNLLILQKLQKKYHLLNFKLELIDFQALRKLYKGLQNKYSALQQSSDRQSNWYQHQRKIFIWFIIFYIYRKEQNKQQMTDEDWKVIAKIFFNKSISFLMFQYLNLIKLTSKISWAPEQDVLLLNAIKEMKKSGWYQISNHMFVKSDLKVFKSPKHCRQRFLNHLDDTKKRGNWTPQEDLAIFRFVSEYGKRWCKIVPILKSSRTEHMIKNRYNSIICKYQKNKKDRQDIVSSKIIKILSKQLQGLSLRKNHDNILIKRQFDDQYYLSDNYQNIEYHNLIKEQNDQQYNDGPIYNNQEASQQVVQKQNKQSQVKSIEKSSRTTLDNISIPNQYYIVNPQSYQNMLQYQLAMNNLQPYSYNYVPVMNYYYGQQFINNNMYY